MIFGSKSPNKLDSGRGAQASQPVSTQKTKGGVRRCRAWPEYYATSKYKPRVDTPKAERK